MLLDICVRLPEVDIDNVGRHPSGDGHERGRVRSRACDLNLRRSFQADVGVKFLKALQHTHVGDVGGARVSGTGQIKYLDGDIFLMRLPSPCGRHDGNKQPEKNGQPDGSSPSPPPPSIIDYHFASLENPVRGIFLRSPAHAAVGDIFRLILLDEVHGLAAFECQIARVHGMDAAGHCLCQIGSQERGEGSNLVGTRYLQ